MQFFENVQLDKYSTMRLGGKARYLCTINSEDDLQTALNHASKLNLRHKVIGSGSNLVWKDSGFDGLVIVNAIKGISCRGDILTAAAGESWDGVVKYSVDAGLSGIEFLSWIPGSTGATPVQNVGAYGKELKDVLVKLRAYDTELRDYVGITNNECGFGYRKSRFNSEDADRFVITQITLQLSKDNARPPFYKSLQQFLDDNNVSNFTPRELRRAVIEVRKAKLPDPDHVANNGSFFANPVIDNKQFREMRQKYPDIPNWEQAGSTKVSAAWLIDKSGFKDYYDEETGMATWHKQPLVLINENAKSFEDLHKFVTKIVDTVQAKFGVKLEQEPELVE